MRKFRKLAALVLAMSMILGMLTINASAAEAKTFSDVTEEDWFYDAVQYVSENDLMNGVGEGLFDPNGTTTRGMVVTVLWRLEGSPEVEETTVAFSDVSDGEWYADAVAWAAEKSIALGHEDGTFLPEDDVTREELVTFFYRWAEKVKEWDVTEQDDLAAFEDAEDVQEYAKIPMAWAVAIGLIKGETETTLCPIDDATRAELAMILYRLPKDADLEDEDTALADLPDLPSTPSIPSTPAHVHSFGEWNVTKDPTCTEAGEETRTCSAGDATETSPIAALGHTVVTDAAVPATCTEDGKTEGRHCSLCGEVLVAQEDIPATGRHNTDGVVEYKAATCTDDGVEGGTYCTVCEDGKAAAETVIPATGHNYVDGVCTGCGDLNAEGETKAAKAALETVLAGITGNDETALVEIGGEGNAYTVTLNTDAIKGSGESFGDDLLNGLVTNLKEALDSYFDEYTLTVNNKAVYANKNFNNTALKEAIYDVAGGFFYTLANMENKGGVYTYKTVNGVVTNTANTEDTYGFSVAIQLSGNDVAKVQNMADILEKHLSMTTMTAAEVEAAYGTQVTGEGKFIVVKAEMPSAIMNSLKEELGLTDEILAGATEEEKAQALALIAEKFNRQKVSALLDGMSTTAIENIVGNGVDGVKTLITMVNDNANLVNKVLSKLTITVDGKLLINGTFAPQGNDWEALVNAIVAMLGEGGNVTPGDFTTELTDHYLVPITVGINLGETFNGTETVLFDLHIPLSEMFETTTTPKPEVKDAEDVTNEAVVALKEKLAVITGNGGAQLVAVTETETGYAAILDADAIKGSGQSFGDSVLDGLVTNLKAALDEHFGEYTLTVGGEAVYVNGEFNNTNLKAAIYDVAGGFFYTLANMEGESGVYTYKTVNAVVAGEGDDTYSFSVAIQLKGDDVEKVQNMASILADHLSMTKMNAAEAAEYGISGEGEFILVKAEMPGAIMNSLKEELGLTDEILAEATEEEKAAALALITEKFNRQTVKTLMDGMSEASIEGIVGNGVDGVKTLITMVNDNANLVNKVLSKLTITVDGKLLINGTFAPQGNDWEALVNAIVAMLGEGGNVTPSQFQIAQDYYLVPITVDINLGETFRGTETVLFELHIPLSDLVK